MLSPQQNTSLRLQQKMAPQLIQSLRLLQMSALDLELEIKQQLELNPLLEEAIELRQEEEEELLVREGENGIKEEEEMPEDMEKVDWDALLGDQFDASAYNSERTEYDVNWDPDREPQESRITTAPPLVEQLRQQLGEVGGLGPEERTIAEYIIGSIDERGYLGYPLANIATDLNIKVAAAEKVLRVIQSFDPPGIGARDLRECMMIQLSQRDDPLSALAYKVVRDHLEDLPRRRVRRITRALGIGSEKLKEVVQVIESLQPHPSLSASSSYDKLLTLDTEVAHITPDLIFDQADGEWVISLVDESMPPLRINTEYQQWLSQARDQDAVQDYVTKHLDDAHWLIHALAQRRSTLLKVAHYLLRVQLPFFEQGPTRLRPMVLQEVADAVGMHVSTISRVSNGKYMQTPHGVFELKYFFDNKLITEAGEDVSVRSVKAKISQLVADEDKVRPLSDQQIVEELSKGGLKIARRTVAKYRDQLKIPAQRYRKAL